ncbi:MAG: Alanine racemase [Caulobacteraceae bacterium]|nr:Alanine racemase [Caulobacteraceae bacterium]
MSRACLTIDLDALAHNYGVVRTAAGGAEISPVVKADGYGLGAGPIARRLWREGAHSYFVARLEEGEALREELGGLEADILVLDGFQPGEEERIDAAGLTPVLNTLEQARAYRGSGAVLHFDTGMNRIGLAVDEAASVIELGLPVRLVISHLSAAVDPGHPRNGRQLARFESVRRLFPGARASLAASAGIWLGEDYRFDLVRPGISLFGGGPREVPDPTLRAVARLEAPVLQVRDLSAGDSVGYGDMFTAPHEMRIAVLGAGYADGMLRRGAGRTQAWLNGAAVPILAVTMDLIAIDITSQPEPRHGQMAELLGPNILLDDLAAAVETAPHECLTRLSTRAQRVYAERSAILL